MQIGKFTTNTAQTLTAAEPAIIWRNDEIKGGCGIYHKPGTGKVEIAGSGCRCNPKPYIISAHINATGLAGQVQLGIFTDGDEMPTARMSYYAAGVGNIISVDSTTVIAVASRCSSVTVRALTPGVTVNSAEMDVIPVKKEA